ncbi:uncharacterized protein BJ171DRAFT_504096 [Polychytrium aggregatum]|uniref:uncharacterized protein n=1 Tax=Polychytrium aggregatum TaxID=110093 RepID=UPI0022FF0898|nr:uncharacterized protein BJ171DRAFT_504096 [Polychytrium aggregatum]KAI9204925.1 hypothetical protein BJ171DRAFT_504096 [Polychytrium aggregatum]
MVARRSAIDAFGMVMLEDVPVRANVRRQTQQREQPVLPPEHNIHEPNYDDCNGNVPDSPLTEPEPEPNPEHECGCCYNTVPMDQTVPCEEGHLFCADCVRRAAEEAIGMRRSVVKCMNTDPCGYAFHERELRQLLPEPSFDALMRLRLAEGIGILTDFVECPFCNYGAEILAPLEDEPLFHCQNPECAVVSCRRCKKENHSPRKCDDLQKEDNLNVQHKIEEDMSEALFLTCPKCRQKIIKEDGCNKITCVCGQFICYVCRQAIQNYSHFNNNGGPCPLYDDATARLAQQVQQAYQNGVANNAIDQNDLLIDVPTAQNILR